MKTISAILGGFASAVLITAMIVLACMMASCSAERQDWKPAKVKMTRVMYNGSQETRGYKGY